MWPTRLNFFKMTRVYKSQLVEIVNAGVPGGNTSTRIQFQDQPYLRNKQIMGIELLTGADMAGFTSPTGRAIYDLTTASAYLTLYLNDVKNPNNVGEWIQNVPMPILHRVQNSASNSFVRKAYELAGQVIYWEKCFISLPLPLSNTSDTSFLFNVYFTN